MQILEDEGLQESCLNESTGGEGECKGGTKAYTQLKKEKKREEQEMQGEKSLEAEIFPQGSFSFVRAFPNKDEKNGDGSYPSPHAQGRGKGQLFLKPMPAKIREDYQHFQDELQKLSGYRKDSKQIQQVFVRVYDKKAPILQYLAAFLKKEPGKDVFWYLHDRKWIQYTKSRREIPIPRNAVEARILNDRYRIADLLRKHRHLDCIILDGKNKFPERVPEGIPYMLGPGRYFMNEEGVRKKWDPKTENSE